MEEGPAVPFFLEDRRLLAAAGGHMMDSAALFDAEGKGQGARIAEEVAICSKRDLMIRVPVQKNAGASRAMLQRGRMLPP
jgi:hypothetical protein